MVIMHAQQDHTSKICVNYDIWWNDLSFLVLRMGLVLFGKYVGIVYVRFILYRYLTDTGASP